MEVAAGGEGDLVIKIPVDAAIHTFSAKHVPVLQIESGEIVQLEVMDCFSNRLRSGVWSPTGPEDENPATGPVYVRGARPGHMLRVDVLSIDVLDYGVIESVPGSGCLGQYVEKARARLVPVKNGEAILSDTLRVPVSPMIGVLGVAPAEGEPMTMLPGDHGGNMDCTRIGIGSTVYLPIFVEGALLAAGDLHAAMGDGEIGVSGLEIPGSVTLRLSVEERFYVPFPVVFNQGRGYAVASAVSLDQACEQAAKNLYQFAVQVGGVPVADVIPLMTIAADMHVCQMVNQLRTACMSLPLEYCPMVQKMLALVKPEIRIKKKPY